MKKQYFLTIKKFFANLGEFILSHFFLSLLIVLVLAFAITAFLFYKYYFLSNFGGSGIQPKSVKISKTLLDKISREWQKREKLFQDVQESSFPDSFRGF